MWQRKLSEAGTPGSGDGAGARVGEGGPDRDKDSVEDVGESAEGLHDDLRGWTGTVKCLVGRKVWAREGTYRA